MELLDFAKGNAWTIVPEKFEALARSIFNATPGKDAVGETYMQRAGQSADDGPYEIRDGVAIIPIAGSLSKRKTFFSWLFGGSTYADIAERFTAALEDADVQGILLDIDSPGGTVNGVEAVGDLIFNARGTKPIVAFGNGMMTSAAYWLGSAADTVIAESTTDVGSIGVLMVHIDYSVMDAKAGVKITYLSAGKYKALGNDAEPLSQEARDQFQAELDYLYSIFVNTISRNRDVEIEDVLSRMADGKIFIGQQAQDAGLIDKVGNLDMAVETVLTIVDNNTTTNRRFIMDKNKNSVKIDTVEQLSAAYPDLVEDIRQKAIAGVDITGARTEASGEENKRILGLVEAHFGEDAGGKFRALVDTGVSVQQLKAIKDIEPAAGESAVSAEEQKQAEMLEAIHKAGAPNPGAGDPPNTGDKDFMSLVAEHQQLHKCGKVDAMKAVMKSNPQAHKGYIESVN